MGEYANLGNNRFRPFFIIADFPGGNYLTFEKFYLIYICSMVGGLLGGEILESNISALVGGGVGFIIGFLLWLFYFYSYIHF
jgi:hypothetical protein